MDIIDGFLAEEDVQYMNDELLIHFGKMCNDVLAELFRKYLEDSAGNKNIQERIKTLIGDIVYRNTFHIDVINSGIKDIVMRIDLSTLPLSVTDYDVLLEAIDFVKENKDKMIAVIDPRERSSYKEFISLAKKFDTECIVDGIKLKYPNLANRIESNKRVFYSPNEKPVSTRLRGVINKVKDCETAEKGIYFLKHCEANSVMGWRRCEF